MLTLAPHPRNKGLRALAHQVMVAHSHSALLSRARDEHLLAGGAQLGAVPCPALPCPALVVQELTSLAR